MMSQLASDFNLMLLQQVKTFRSPGCGATHENKVRVREGALLTSCCLALHKNHGISDGAGKVAGLSTGPAVQRQGHQMQHKIPRC